ncbi:MAG: S8 family peptidase [Crocinitomicaceae bacterium]
MKQIFVTLFVLVFFSIVNGQKTSALTIGKIQLIKKYINESGGEITSEIRRKYPIHNFNGKEYVSFLAKVNSDFNQLEMANRGVLIGSRINDIVTVRYPLDMLDNVLNETTFSYFKMAGMIQPNLDKVRHATHVDSVWQGINLPQGYSGQNVIVGVQDWGFDFTHPMFYDTTLTYSRILACWDQYKNSGPAPSSYGYGTEIIGFNDLQSAQSDTSGMYGYATHGTHVAGIAGGSGAGTIHRGMAFECEFIFATLIIDESFAIDGWDWMYHYAQSEGKRLVINCSWGVYQIGALDGTDLLSQALDGYVQNDVVIVTSAGNNGDSQFHIKKAFASDTIQTRIEFMDSGMPVDEGQDVHMWGRPGKDFSIQLLIKDNNNNLLNSSPWYHTASSQAFLDSFIVASGTDTVFFNLSVDDAYPSNGYSYMHLQILNLPVGYRAGFKATAIDDTVHFFNLISFSHGGGNWGIPFSYFGNPSITGDSEYSIGQPACADLSLAIGAYIPENIAQNGIEYGGQVANFTSHGPLIDGSLKPDINAPGSNIISSMSSFTTETVIPVETVNFQGTDYYFEGLSGTSMSSPATVGIVALVLQANPYLSGEQVREVIMQSARKDQYTGAIPPHSTIWGWGKLNAYAAVQLAIATTGFQEYDFEPAWTIYPNPANDQMNIAGIEGKVKKLEVYDLNGKMILNLPVDTQQIQTSLLESGVYILRVVRDGFVEQRKFVKQ